MQNYYEQHVFNEVPNVAVQLSLVGSLGLAFLRLMGPVAQWLAPKISQQGVLVLGCAMKALGMICAGFSREIYQLYICQGIIFGSGASFMYYTSQQIVVSGWFDGRKGIALGLIASGSGLGGLIIPFIMSPINNRLGPDWTFRILGFVCLAMDGMACLMIKEFPDQERQSEKKNQKLREIIRLSVFKSGNYWLWMIASCITLLGYFNPFYFLPSYGRYYAGMTDNQGSLLVAIISIFNFVGRASTGVLADYLGQLNTIILFNFISSLACFLLWGYAFTFGSMIAFSAVFGMTCGCYFSVLSPVTSIILGKALFPTGLSFLLITNILGVFGPNFASSLESDLVSQSNYQPYFSYKMWSGACYLASCVVLLILRFRMAKQWNKII
ncbi:MFS general substrate transporter [Hesseltinella vesiculosa]|uniref:MFS general substrate transporter n=1 Tax=Hesseltinella vesiculosa TaxID=101127 RepID=A0A1X2GG73_9FUNG|nr:MFS general substrate transporter [Hesseltinella vesiculosa]